MALNTTIQIPISSTALNLNADARNQVPTEREIAEYRYVENTGTRTVYWRDRGTAPASTDTGHRLNPGESAVFRAVSTSPLWFWSPSASELTVSNAHPVPVRGTA